MERFMVSMPDEMRERLRILAFQRRTSIAEEIRKAIEEYLRKESDNK